MTAERDGHDALDELFWRAEILQALYWMRGEGLASEIEPGALAEFLVAERAVVADFMRRLAAEGYLEHETGPGAIPGQPTGYRLTPKGVAEGGRSFHDEFADLLRQGHGECGPGCTCHRHGPEACKTPAA